MGEEVESLSQKLLFYTTASFILLGTFSAFAFLFLVPFVIDPAFTTIFMQFDERPAECITIDVESRRGTSNCSWTSCKIGCTRELYECTQIRVNYKLPVNETGLQDDDADDVAAEKSEEVGGAEKDEAVGRYGKQGGPNNGGSSNNNNNNYYSKKRSRKRRSLIRDYDYIEDLDDEDFSEDEDDVGLPKPFPTGLLGNDSEWYFTGAKLFPNVKGCGYPPMLNCTIFVRQYATIGTNFSCYYSKVDPGIVISDLDMHQVYMNLVYAMAIPIPSFIISVIYLTVAYFKIYNEEEVALVGAEEDGQAEGGPEDGVAPEGENNDAVTPLPTLGSGVVTPGSEAFLENLESFGHQLKVAMADDISRESLDGIPDNYSMQGSLNKTMTTSISTHPGPTAAV